jgi:hypothetical protein
MDEQQEPTALYLSYDGHVMLVLCAVFRMVSRSNDEKASPPPLICPESVAGPRLYP